MQTTLKNQINCHDSFGRAFERLRVEGDEDTSDSSRSLISPYWSPNFRRTSTSENSGAGVVCITYIGQNFDDESSLNYLQARYQDPTNGQFVSQDPSVLTLGGTNAKAQVALVADPQQLNTYSYARNNPMVFKDPKGECLYDGCVFETAVLFTIARYSPQIVSFLSSLSTPLGQVAVSQAVDDVQNGDYEWAAFGMLTAGEGSAVTKMSKADNMLLNALNGARREAQFGRSLVEQFGSEAVQSQVYLRNADGTIARDAFGSARRLDFAVIKDGKVQGLYEVTSPTADKTAQIAKEDRVRQAGGTYIRDRQTGNLIDVSKNPTQPVRIE